MFRQLKKQAPTPSETPKIDVKEDVYRAGKIAWIQQNSMNFGSNRHTITNARPGVVIRIRDKHVFVLPSTTKHKPSSDSRFFPVHKEDAIWINPDNFRESYVFQQYEAVSPEDLFSDIGMLHPPVQLQIVAWLHSRY